MTSNQILKTRPFKNHCVCNLHRKESRKRPSRKKVFRYRKSRMYKRIPIKLCMLSYFHQQRRLLFTTTLAYVYIFSGSVSSPASLVATSSSMNGVNKAAAFSSTPSPVFGSLISTSEAQNTSVELNWSAAVSRLQKSGLKYYKKSHSSI